ncbi:MAG: NUDIX domain-containing protein [Clostridia bacterium]|nr:NUDIX domain-containing protein [Clostridia bacterium]
MICLYEKSCGAVVYRKTASSDIKILLVKNHNGKCWTFPKGHVENNETEQQTALREIKEETGLTVKIEPNFRQTSVYRPFGKIKKRVVFFLARSEDSNVSLQPSEIDFYRWASIDEALHMCHHENDTKILLEVRKRFNSASYS